MTLANIALPTPLQSARKVSPMLELGAYECLWLEKGATWKRMADKFRASPNALPSEVLGDDERAYGMGARVLEETRFRGLTRFGVRVHRAGEYPSKLRDARHPVELLYFRGIWELVDSPCVAIVGTRTPSDDGVKRARRLARELGEAGWTVVSGLAAGIDTAAHTAALKAGKHTIAVVGTAIDEAYPSENRQLQEHLAHEKLVISQVPILRYHSQDWRQNRSFFPERNVTMSALTAATIIVEAGETSGTLTQARAALHQNRKLFILDNCFKGGLMWPSRFEKKGAVRVTRTEQILDGLASHGSR